MNIDRPTGIALAAVELLAVAAVVHLWLRPRGESNAGRVLWSLLLLVPVFGLMLYAFTRLDPKEHGERVPDSSADDPNSH